MSPRADLRREYVSIQGCIWFLLQGTLKSRVSFLGLTSLQVYLGLTRNRNSDRTVSKLWAVRCSNEYFHWVHASFRGDENPIVHRAKVSCQAGTVQARETWRGMLESITVVYENFLRRFVHRMMIYCTYIYISIV